jgi:propionate CoA-transferase
VVFVGTFTAGRLKVAIEDGRLRIVNDGTTKKFVRAVEHRTFSGGYAVARGQPVLYVTERCVFELTGDGLELTEVAPGIDIEREILAQMEFKPVIRRDPFTMDQRIFAPAPMGLRDDLLRMPLEQRFTYHPPERQFFINFEGHVVRSRQDVEHIRRIVEGTLTPLGHKVYAIVNYENFQIFPDIMDAYSEMVRNLSDRFYLGVTRYTTNGFLRTKLGDALSRRAVAPHIYESAEEARAHLRALEGRAAG